MDNFSNTAIEASNLYFTYQEGTRALKNINFSVKKGEFVALLASNGSGKTTLINVLVGLLKPLSGDVRINGRQVKNYSRKELCQIIGLVMQNPKDQLFAPTVEEDIGFGPRNLGLLEKEVQSRVTESLESVDAAKLRNRAIHHLSFGEQKRVVVAGVLAMRPAILILDEPTAGLDPHGETLMMRLLNRLNRKNHITVVLATHSVDMLPLFADRICVLKKGKILKNGTVNETFRDHEMLERASLRLPYVASLLHEMKKQDGVLITGLPLTVNEARKKLLDLIPEELICKQIKKT